jgi:hypothetical protein
VTISTREQNIRCQPTDIKRLGWDGRDQPTAFYTARPGDELLCSPFSGEAKNNAKTKT